MNDLLTNGPFTPFDILVAVLVLASGLMALARGFLREIASTLAFGAAIAAAAFAYFVLAPLVRDQLPVNLQNYFVEGVLVLIAFLFVYIIGAWLGKRVSRFVHAATDIGLIDRLIGLIFGIFRGFAVIVLVLLLVNILLGSIELPWIVNSVSYPHLMKAVIWVQNIFMSVAENSPSLTPDGTAESP